METRRITRRQAQQLGVTPTKELLPTSSRKTSARKGTRKALADRTNDSPVSGLAPAMAKSGGRSGYMFETPCSKLRPLTEGSPGTPGEDVLRSQVQSLLEKIGSDEPRGVGMRTLLGLVAPTPTNTPASGTHTVSSATSSPSAFTPQLQNALSFIEESPAVCHQPDVPSAGNSTGTTMEIPSESGPSATAEVDESAEANLESEEGCFLPLDMQILYLLGKSSVQGEDDEDSIAEEGALDLNVLKHIEAVCKEDNEAHNSSTVVPDSSPQSGLTTMSPYSPSENRTEWVSINVEDGICHGDLDDGISDGISECSVVVNVSSPGADRDEASSHPVPDKPICNVQTDIPSLWQQRGSPVKASDKEEMVSNDYEDYEGDEEEGGEYEGGQFDEDCDELCRGISHISMTERDVVGLPAYAGRHIRFNYNSDDEIEDEEVICGGSQVKAEGEMNPDILRLRGLPTPKGKHLRFKEDVSSPSA